MTVAEEPPPPPTRKVEPAPPAGEKSEWPELVGLMAVLAAQTIAHERPDVAVEVLPVGSYIIPGYNAKRVRVHIDSEGLVSKVPVLG